MALRVYSILEFSFYLNLGTVLYAHATNGNQADVIYISTSIAFFTFIGTVFSHMAQSMSFVFFDISSRKIFKLGQRNHCFKYLKVNVRK